MRSALICLLVVGFMSCGWSATLRNRDFRQYRLELQFPNGRVGHIIVAGSSRLSGLCPFDGCAITILETRESAIVGPQDDVVIFYGRLQVRRSRFR